MNLDMQGRPFTDLGSLTAGTVDDVGQYTVTLVTSQDATNSNNGYFQPERGFLPQQSQDVILTIHPCLVTTYGSI